MEAAPQTLIKVIPLVRNSITNLIKKVFPLIQPGEVIVQNVGNDKVEYNSPSLVKLYNMNKKDPSKILGSANAVQMCQKLIEAHNPQEDPLISLLSVAEPQGFLNVTLQDDFVTQEINTFLKTGIKFPQESPMRIAVDFSSPNIAKEMHVGHLRSTIIGESICRILEFQGHLVDRINHVGDWGTQFGMLICHLKDTYPEYKTKAIDLQDLTEFYRASKKRFDEDAEFKQRSQLEVVALQGGDPECLKAWQTICDVSRLEFNEIYRRLDVNVKEVGESFYNPMIPDVIKILEDKGMVKVDEGAQCIYLGGQFQIPLMVQKKDGGFNYDSTDMAAIYFRLHQLKANRLIYITDVGQQDHFFMIFEGSQQAGWHDPTKTRIDHMGFGLVQGEGGKKFKTRSGDTVQLSDLLDEGRDRCLEQMKKRKADADAVKKSKEVKEEESKEPVVEDDHIGGSLLSTEEEFLEAAERIGMAAIKYFDLKQNRISNYEFSYDKMLDTKGNTAVYLLYSYARLCSIIRKSGYSEKELDELINSKGFSITHSHERYIAAAILQYTDVIQDVTDDLKINILTDYIYEIATKISQGYKKYQVIEEEHQATRILLCEATRRLLKHAFYLVGIVPVDQI